MGFSTAQTMFGRDRECAALVDVLDDPSVRLVTITGRGGVGKTRLATELTERFRRAGRVVVVVALDGVATSELVMGEVAAALDIPPQPGIDLADTLTARLRDEPLVLVIDNFEHVLAAAPALSAALESAPALQIVVASQSPLRLRFEHVFALEPLAVDAPDVWDSAKADEHAAIALYAQRAAAVAAGFEVDDGNVAVIADLCDRLEGLPLAIELAAARAATLPPQEILQRLDDAPLDLLRRDLGDTPQRHHDLRATIDWTFRLLTREAQYLLCRLSLVSGAFDLDTVVSLSAATSLGDAIDTLASLVDFHLVDPVRATDPTRYTIPSSIRAYCHDELRTSGAYEKAVHDHVGFRAIQADAAAAGIASAGEPKWLQSLNADHQDMLAALEAAIDAELVHEALQIVVGLGPLLDMRGYHGGHEALFDRALQLGERQRDTSLFVNALLWSAMLGLRYGAKAERATLLERLRRGEQLARDIGDTRALLCALSYWIIVTTVTGDVAKATSASSEGLALAAGLGDERLLGAIEVWSGMLAQQIRDDDRAVALGLSAVQRAHRCGDRRTLVLATLLLVPLRRRRPSIAPEVPPIAEALQCAREAGLALYEAVLLPMMVADVASSRDVPATLEWMAQSLAVARTMPGSRVVGYNVMAMLTVAAVCDDYPAAAYFHGAIRSTVPALSRVMAPQQVEAYEAMLDRTRRVLGGGRFEAEAARGAAVSADTALRAALAFVERHLERDEADRASPRDGAANAARLTDRQREVLGLLVAGLGNKEIAAQLGISNKTVMHHTGAIYRALGVRGRAEAAAAAVRGALID